jgi:3-oxoadipate enol-lactonase
MRLAHATLGDGCRIAYRLDGPTDAPVLMLSNSLGTNLGMWAPQMEALVQSFRVLRYDSRGHGASDAPLGAYSLDRLGRDAVELLDALDLERVHFCGLSKGGMVGQWLGVRAPERVHRLVLANTSAYMGPPAGWQQRIDTVLRDGMGAVTDDVLEKWFTPEFRSLAPDAVAAVRDMLLATDPGGYAGCCAALRDMDLRPTAPLIAAPTLLVAGARDPSTPPACAHELARAMRHAPRVATLDAAHLSNIEQAGEFTAIVLDFLA